MPVHVLACLQLWFKHNLLFCVEATLRAMFNKRMRRCRRLFRSISGIWRLARLGRMMATAYKNGHHGHHPYCEERIARLLHQDDSDSCDSSVGTSPGAAEAWEQRRAPDRVAASALSLQTLVDAFLSTALDDRMLGHVHARAEDEFAECLHAYGAACSMRF